MMDAIVATVWASFFLFKIQLYYYNVHLIMLSSHYH